MIKRCKCGARMEVNLHTIMYSSQVEIECVPVLTCAGCQRSELHQAIKEDLTGLISRMGSKPIKQRVRFDELNELAYLLRVASGKVESGLQLDSLFEERINQLLDLLLLSRSLQDAEWTQDIHRRLTQIAGYAAVSQRAGSE